LLFSNPPVQKLDTSTVEEIWEKEERKGRKERNGGGRKRLEEVIKNFLLQENI
jgi:hypothetical protein